MTTALPTLPALQDQAERLVSLGVHELAGLPAAALRELGACPAAEGLLVLHPDLVRPSALAPLLRRDGKPGFVVTDMQDVDAFTPIPCTVPPAGAAYVVEGVERGDEMASWSPDEALPALLAAGRTPLTLTEGIHWLLQHPDALERNRCFMTIGSRLPTARGGLDSRTPALWISNGSGRDGSARRGAHKVGWCWAGNRHTWLGFASASGRAVVVP